MTDADMWLIAAEAGSMLDDPDCDWRTLQEIEALLSSLTAQLQREAGDLTGGRLVRSDLQLVQTSLDWVRQHEYDALESDLQKRLAVALDGAMATLVCLERSDVGKPSVGTMAGGDRR